MNTAYYTFTTWSGGAMAAGFDGGARQAAMVRQSRRAQGGDNVIDLSAWRAANPELCPEEGAGQDGWAGEAGWAEEACLEEAELALPAPRPRRSRRAAFAAELASTLSVAAAALAIILRVAVF